MALISSWRFWLSLVAAMTAFGWLWPYVRGRWQPAFWLRILMVVLTIMALFIQPGSIEDTGYPSPEIFIVDLSESVDLQSRAEMVEAAESWQSATINRQVIVVGLESPFEAMPEDWTILPDFATALDDIAATSLNSNLRIILGTDGQSTQIGAVADQFANLKEEGHAINLLPLSPVDRENDLYVARLLIPGRVWAGTPSILVANIVAPSEGISSIQLTVNENVVETREINLDVGENNIPFPINPAQAGNLTISLSASWQGDPQLVNNQGFAVAEVIQAPTVLILTDQENISNGLATSLRSSGMTVDLRPPMEMPTSGAGISNYQIIILDNVLAHTLSVEQLISLENFVADQGRGLVVLGGRSAYGLGGYEGTALEDLLPVSLTPPERAERPPVTFLMVLDRSGSMQGERGLAIRPIDLAREAAIRAVETLRPDDYLGVLTFSGEPVWEVNIRPLGTGLTARAATDAISQITPQGGTNMYLALETALGEILDTRNTQTVHILLLTDGISFDGSLETFNTLALLARTHDISISTIALGNETDPTTLSMIADTAEGRFFAVTDPSELPRILVAESKAARSENVQQGVVNLVPNIASHPVLLGISPVNLPALSAYNAVSSRTSLGAEDILVSANFQDPVLSAWGYGLGRVIAWMGDSGDEWARGWPAETQFWGQVARYALPDPSISSTQATLTPQGDIFAIELQARSPEGVPINFAAPEFSYVDENGQIRSFALTQIAPGVYQTEIKVPPAGAYRGLISFIGQQGYQEIAAPFAIPVSPELFPVDQEEAAATISRWQNAGEAELIGFEDLMVTEDLETPKASFDLRAWLVGGLIVYWVLEIAARRRWLPWN